MLVMKIDIERILQLDYLNSCLLQINANIEEIKSNTVEHYDFNTIVAMNEESIKILFNKYGVDYHNVIEYKNSVFLEDFEYADLFPLSVAASLEKKKKLEQTVLTVISELNSKIDLVNDNIRKSVSLMEQNLNLINEIIRIVSSDKRFTLEEINAFSQMIIKSNLSDDDKFNLSYVISKYLIEKNRTLLEKISPIIEEDTRKETLDFEQSLSDVYDELDSDKDSDKKESPHLEIINKYYGKYEELFKQTGLGDNLDDALVVANELSVGLSHEIDSIAKEDFCIEIANLLHLLKFMYDDADIVSEALSELEKLDNLYDEYISILDNNDRLLIDVNVDREFIDLLEIDSSDKKKIADQLKKIFNELKDNIISSKRREEIEKEYSNLKPEIEKLREKVNILTSLFKLKESIENKITSLSRSVSSSNSNLYEVLIELQEKISILIDKVEEHGIDDNILMSIDEVSKQFDGIEMPTTSTKENESVGHVKLKGFVLFDFDEDNVPYVVNDLDPKSKDNNIDITIEHGKLAAGLREYCKLIKDLLLIGKPEILANGSPSYIDTILYNIYVDNKNHSTSMVRIRPLRNSVARFVEQKVLLLPGTEIFEQVTGIIKEILPNVEISPDEEFSLYVNFASGMKQTDVELYEHSKRRYNLQSPLHKMLIADSGKKKLTDEQCKLLREFIHMSLDAYSKLEKKNPMVKFDVIDQIGGKKTYGI